ncbi:magnesium transporter MRS2-4 [Senna tora]|uniref:Magnesium transporter n=1 Tax=Senna tora TaxID=362788 RepID=A0A834SNF4_9FABA|nr:magnesium transporter MRS2-4 [Senna tora]
MVVNLEFIKAIVTAEEVLLLDPLCQEVIPFVEQLRQQLPYKSQPKLHDPAEPSESLQQHELPFEFQFLEIALEVVCTYLESSVADLERGAYPVLDELARNVSTKNLQNVRSLKSNLTRLLARVQKFPILKLPRRQMWKLRDEALTFGKTNVPKYIILIEECMVSLFQVRDELEHLLDDNENMAQLYLTRKWVQNQQSEAHSGAITLNRQFSYRQFSRQSSYRSGSFVTCNFGDYNDVEDLEMLLEAYFMQLDGTRNKILSVREYIDDTEDYVNIQLDNQRNELIQLQLTLILASFAIAVNTLISGAFGMNIPCQLYETEGIFWTFVWSTSAACMLLFLLILGYARWKMLIN